MDKDTLENNAFIGPYRYGPVAAHSLTQWYSDSVNEIDSLPKKPDYDNQQSSVETAEYSQDNEQSREARLS